MHNLTSLGTASLDTMGGLITFANAKDLPEGASPRNWDVDYIIGSVITRPGLSSVYSFTQVYDITAISFSYGVGTFTYSPLHGAPTPTVNETFVLSGFIGTTYFLNNVIVVVESVDPVTQTFQALVSDAPTGTFTGLSGTATSTVGNFVGPNVGDQAVGINWNNPTGVLGNISYASSIPAGGSSLVGVPTTESNGSGSQPWSSTSFITSTGNSFAQVVVSHGTTSNQLFCTACNLAVPVSATITGISISGQGFASQPSAGLIAQLVSAGVPVGVPQTVTLATSVKQPVSFGSSSYLWGGGALLTPTLVNASGFGVLLSVINSNPSVSSTGNLNSLAITVYFTTPASSSPLQVTGFAFAIPSTTGVSGLATTFQAYTDSSATAIVQLLKDGIPVGDPKEVVLTTSPTIYTRGGSTDLWSSLWTYADVNNTSFGVQITPGGTGTVFINDLDVVTYITPQLANFNYVKTYKQDDGQYLTLALDSTGILWREDLNNNPGTLSVALTGILPESYAKSATALDREYICFSDLSIGTDRPRTYDGTNFWPLSQVGPGAPPAFTSSIGTSGATLDITSFSITGNVITYTFTATGYTPVVGDLYTVSGEPTNTYINITNTVLSIPAPSTTQFSMALVHGNVGSTACTAVATLNYAYPIKTITQPAANPVTAGWSLELQSSGPGQRTPGYVVTVYYAQSTLGFQEDPTIAYAFSNSLPLYVYIKNDQLGFAGTWLVTGHGQGVPPTSDFDQPRWYFTFNVGSSALAISNKNPTGTYECTLATLTTTVPIPNISTGDSINIQLATPSGWDGTWPIVQSLKNCVMDITNTQMDALGNATYAYTTTSVLNGAYPEPGQIILIQGCTNNSIFNVTGVISSGGGTASGSFVISGFPVGQPITSAPEGAAQGETYGNQFYIDPGAKTVGIPALNPIYGNDTGVGSVLVTGGSTTPIGAGTRQGVVFFITETGYETAPSPPITFTTSSDANYISAVGIPIGPANVIARGIAFTEAGQNGVPGANFYVIPEDVQVVNGNTTLTYTATIIQDNTSTTAKFTFTDNVLLNSEEVDIQGNNLFNLIELGSPAWCVPYANRMFYGLTLNKVLNFNNLSFDGGYLPNPTGNIIPSGWNVSPGTTTATLRTSQVTGQSLYIYNDTGATLLNAGLMSQTAYQDPYKQAIIQPNTFYSVRVAASCPSGNNVGTLYISLADNNPGLGYGTEYGAFSVPLTSMTSNTVVFSGAILTSPIIGTVSSALNLWVQVKNLGNGSDCQIDRIEVYPTQAPYNLTQVFGSYINNLEAIDASGQGGIIDTASENPQACMGGFVLHDRLYLLKTGSMYQTEDNPTSEPGGWQLNEVSNKVGACGILAYDTGEEWATMACRAGIYGFNGGQPVKFMQEIAELWDLVNWDAASTIVLKNDITNRRILCAVPLAVPNVWLPFEASNPKPTTPNVILMLNYTGLNTFEELMSQAQLHTTMFGTLASVDMKRKWSIWRIPTPYMDFVNRSPNANDLALLVCNGISSSKIYQFLDDQLSDDGAPIWGLYTTYGFVNAAKAVTMPIFGMHAKRYTVFQTTVEGAGALKVTAYPNTLGAKYPYTIPGTISLAEDMMDDIFRPLNQKGNRIFLEFSTNAVGSWFQLHKILLSGKADSWSPINPTGGGNTGITTT